jgi:flagellar motor switch protein FliM
VISEPSSIQHPAATLVRHADSRSALSAISRTGVRFAKALAEHFQGQGCAGVRATAGEAEILSFADWRDQAAHGAICRYLLRPSKSAAIFHLPAPCVRQLVDTFYGGAGDAGRSRHAFSSGELQFIKRLGERCGTHLAAAWDEFVALSPILETVGSEWAAIDFVRERDTVIVQRIAINGNSFTSSEVAIVYPSDALRTIAMRRESVPEAEQEPEDSPWRDKLTAAVLETRLPLRAVFARPELPLEQLMTLQTGDIFPIIVPAMVPLTVAGHSFGDGKIGEANGRVAIQIQSLRQQEFGTEAYE